MKTAAVLAAVLVLAGCASAEPYVDRAAQGYDKSLDAAELWVCRGASVGSVVRAYGRSDATWQAWLELCERETFLFYQLFELPTVAGEDNVEIAPRLSGDFDHPASLGEVVSCNSKYQRLHHRLRSFREGWGT